MPERPRPSTGPERLSWAPPRPGKWHPRATLSPTSKPEVERYTYPRRPNFCSGALLLEEAEEGRKWRRVTCNGEVEGHTALCASCTSRERESRQELREMRTLQTPGVKNDTFRKM